MEVVVLQIQTYDKKYDAEIISLILHIQNEEAKIDLSLSEQPDLLDIRRCYQKDGGEFWIALSGGKVIGTIGLMLKGSHCAILKSFLCKKNTVHKKSALLYIMNF